MRMMLILAACLAIAGCREGAVKHETEPMSDVPNASAPKGFGKQLKVPQQILGVWKLVDQSCEEEGQPDRTAQDVTVRFDDDFRYEMMIDGWGSKGDFTVERDVDGRYRIRLTDMMYNFDLWKGRLINGSEGDAAYLCSNIFERIP